MTNLKDPRLIYLKGILFLLTGLLSGGLLLYFAPFLIVALLLGVCVWSFCRAYYFAFYVIEHYVDGDFRYAGLLDFFTYAVGQKNGSHHRAQDDPP